MGRAQGYFRAVDPDVRHPIEYDSIQCGHCQKIVFVKPGSASTVYLLPTETPGVHTEAPGAFCGKCMTAICIPCHEKGRCTPAELWLEQQEKAITRKLGWGRFYQYITGGR
ncbi:MAG TPA: hypothetical protein VK504_21010 [Vicinamibacterales bacterium]|nr:hypothetical protein [Vicinamibacterales bacterium]